MGIDAVITVQGREVWYKRVSRTLCLNDLIGAVPHQMYAGETKCADLISALNDWPDDDLSFEPNVRSFVDEVREACAQNPEGIYWCG